MGVKKQAISMEKELFTDGPMVSVVVPTFNSEKTLPLCLQSVKDQTYSNVEVVVVDNYSWDNSVQIAKKFNARVLFLAAEQLRRKEQRCSARNLGAKEAHGAFILFIDSDVELTPKVIEECVTTCLQKNLDVVLIPAVSVVKGGFLAECQNKEIEMFRGVFSGFPKFFRRELFHSIGGFDENLVFGEDFDLARRIEEAGCKTRGVKAEIIHLEGELSMKRIALQTYYYGKTFLSFAKKSPSLAMREYCPIRYFRYFGLLRDSPLHFSGLMFMKFIKHMVALISIFASLLRI